MLKVFARGICEVIRCLSAAHRRAIIDSLLSQFVLATNIVRAEVWTALPSERLNAAHARKRVDLRCPGLCGARLPLLPLCIRLNNRQILTISLFVPNSVGFVEKFVRFSANFISKNYTKTHEYENNAHAKI